MKDKVTRQCPQTTNPAFEEKGESKRYRTEVLLSAYHKYQHNALPLGQRPAHLMVRGYQPNTSETNHGRLGGTRLRGLHDRMLSADTPEALNQGRCVFRRSIIKKEKSSVIN